MAEKLTLEQAAANVVQASEKLAELRAHRDVLQDELSEVARKMDAAHFAFIDAERALTQTALQTKGDK